MRELTLGDLDWVVEITRVRREGLVRHAPRFWNPAADATGRHRAFLAHLIEDPGTTSVRTEHGYLVAPAGRRRMVDDMVVTHDAWPTEGLELLRHVIGGPESGAPVRFVVPVAEEDRAAAATAAGLQAVEAWWHRDLPVVEVRAEGGRVQLDAAGTRGRLVPAPPVYDPGGSIVFVSEVESADGLAAVEGEAASRGATVSVVSQRPDDLMRELLLVGAGYEPTTRFYE